MNLHASSRARLTALALVFAALGAGCGDGGSLTSAAPAPAPAPTPAAPQPLRFGAFPSAVGVVGQVGFDEEAPDGTPGTLSAPGGGPAVTADGRLIVADRGSNTLKVFSRYDQHGTSVDFPGLTTPRSASIQAGRLVVVDDNTVRIFESAAPGAAQLAMVGGTSACSAAGLSAPYSAHLTPGGRLVVADSDNNRVLIWNQVTSGHLGNANVVIGQETMTTCDANGGAAGPSDSTLRGPSSVWSDGNRLVVADTANNRVMIWDSLPAADFQPATTVIGQRNFADAQQNAGGLNFPSAMSLSRPVGVDVSEAGQLAVADQQNDRVLIWDRIPAAGAHGQAADQVLGRDGFTAVGAVPISAKTLSEPDGVRFHGTDLIVVDDENSRVLVWRGTAPPVVSPPPAPGTPPAPPTYPLPPTTPFDPPGPGNGAY